MITLATKDTAFGEITILQRRAIGSYIYCQQNWFQSEADRNGVSLTTYVHASEPSLHPKQSRARYARFYSPSAPFPVRRNSLAFRGSEST